MSLILQGSTSGSITLQEPAISGSTVLTLPAVTGTVLTTTSPKAGNVIQVVNVGYGTYTEITSTTYTDTGLSASITPSSSSNKILVIVSQSINPVLGASVGYGFQVTSGVRLLRGATALITPDSDSGGKYSTGYSTGAAPSSGYLAQWTIVSMNYLDSPATTSSVTYKTQCAKGTSGMGTVYVNSPAGGSYITLMEIAA
jgi:hypothetical protein